MSDLMFGVVELLSDSWIALAGVGGGSSKEQCEGARCLIEDLFSEVGDGLWHLKNIDGHN